MEECECGDRCTLGCHAEAEEDDGTTCPDCGRDTCGDCGQCVDHGNCYCLDEVDDWDLGEACVLGDTECEACQ